MNSGKSKIKKRCVVKEKNSKNFFSLFSAKISQFKGIIIEGYYAINHLEHPILAKNAQRRQNNEQGAARRHRVPGSQDRKSGPFEVNYWRRSERVSHADEAATQSCQTRPAIADKPESHLQTVQLHESSGG